MATALAGCSAQVDDPTTTAPAPPPTGTGYFAGTGPGGIGISVDLLADDRIARSVALALLARDGRAGSVPAVGVASIVNDGPLAIPVPRFLADLENGQSIALRPPGEILTRSGGPAARRALRAVGAQTTRIPAGGAATAYLVLDGAAANAVSSVRVVVVPGRPITLRARRR